jgi:hypothetical protein
MMWNGTSRDEALRQQVKLVFCGVVCPYLTFTQPFNHYSTFITVRSNVILTTLFSVMLLLQGK